jgi:hypothetical protein
LKKTEINQVIIISEVKKKLIMTTPSKFASELRTIIKDYNFWGESESDSPLKISRTALSKFTNDKLLSIDKSARSKAVTGEDLKVLTRTIETETLDDVFFPLVKNSLTELSLKVPDLLPSLIDNSLEMMVEQSEYYIQLFNALKTLTNPKVDYVKISDAPSSYVTLIISGQYPNSEEVVYAYALLTQT